MNYIDTIIGKVITWVDQIFQFARQYSSLLVYGVLAMMVAKFMKVNLKVRTGKK